MSVATSFKIMGGFMVATGVGVVLWSWAYCTPSPSRLGSVTRVSAEPSAKGSGGDETLNQ